jgi:hypothetical protein
MRTLLRILVVRVLRTVGARSRLASRVLVVLGLVRWWNARPTRRGVLRVGPGDVLVVGLEAEKGDGA